MSEETPKFDGCQVLRKISAGPVADLYQGVQEHLGRKVLIKALGLGILPSSPFAATLEREARLLAELQHPNVLGVYDFVREENRMWTVLEWVDGFTVRELLDQASPLPLSSCLAIALEVSIALEHAHAHGIMHRDIQPTNILISKSGRVKLINFTVAVDERLVTAPELLDGSGGAFNTAYMSPEQILGEPADPRSDLFSLGLVLYEMLSGTPAFAQSPGKSAAQRIRHERPEPLGRKVHGLPLAIERLVTRSLEKLAGDRFHSARELTATLEQLFRELGTGSSRKTLLAHLVSVGLTEDAPISDRLPTRSNLPTLHEPTPLTRPLLGLLVASVLVVLGGASFARLSAAVDDSPLRKAEGQLSLAPANAAHLRVVATPWATISVDGVNVGTTPLGAAIPLSGGVHYVRLEHPKAPVEHRSVRLAPGENVLLDVDMKVPVPVEAPRAAAAPVDNTP
ncbi:MAG: serine/threonine-protein kinase [Polyangiaceae bacterium]|nr:serine/threonine-protein kinase [Polyangiaceae bacterium]